MTDEPEVTQEMTEDGKAASFQNSKPGDTVEKRFAAIYRAMHKARPRAKRLQEITQVVNALHGETLRALSDGPAPPEKSET
jgi:hypothetical protein